MKKVFIVLVLTCILLVSLVPSAGAAPPVYEEWVFMEGGGGVVKVCFHINTTNLRTDYLVSYNQSDYPIQLRVKYYDTVVWTAVTPAHTTERYDFVLNFRRLPATDPDDPNSIRYPQGYGFGTAWPWD